MKSLLHDIERKKHIIVYGAMGIAKEAVSTLACLYPDKLLGCAVTSVQGNPSDISGYKVRVLDEYEKMIVPDEAFILLAMRPRYFTELKGFLALRGYHYVGEYFAENRNLLLRMYFRKTLALVSKEG